MAGKKSVYVCGECGYESGRWMGKCPGCEAWNTMVEEIQQPARPAAEPAQSPRLLREIGGGSVQRLPTGSAELDRQCARSGVIQEVRKREHYEKPSVKRKKKAEAARKRKY